MLKTVFIRSMFNLRLRESRVSRTERSALLSLLSQLTFWERVTLDVLSTLYLQFSTTSTISEPLLAGRFIRFFISVQVKHVPAREILVLQT